MPICSAAAAAAAPRSPPPLQPDFHRERTKVSCCSGRGVTHALSGSLRSAARRDTSRAQRFFPMAQRRPPHGAQGSINILPPDSTLSSNCFASNPDQTRRLPKLRYKRQREAQQHKHILHAQNKDKENLFCLCSPPSHVPTASSSPPEEENNKILGVFISSLFKQ